MRYENYRNRVLRLSALLSKVVKHLALILTICGIILAVVVTLLATIGLPGKVDCPAQIIYGSPYGYDGRAFLSDVRFEFKAKNSDVWDDVAPYLPGDYQIRAVGQSVFDKDRYGKPTDFSILPAPLKLWVTETDPLFGETPSWSADPPQYEDKIFCEGFVYDDIAASTTKVTPDVAKIQILDKNGNDVTYAYDLQPQSVSITFRKRPLKVVVGSTSKTYDATALTYDSYQIAVGYSLGPDDCLNAVFSASITDVGTKKNSPVLTVYHAQNGASIDVTSQYDIQIEAGSLQVNPQPLYITTGSLDVVYTGNAVSCTDYAITKSFILPGHRIEVSSPTTVTECGSYENMLNFRIFDASGREVTSNYCLFITTGTIQIKPVALTIRTESASWEYDGLIHEHRQFTVDGLMQGHRVSEQFAPGAVSYLQNVGKIENRIKLTIVDENGNDVSHCYAFSYEYGTLEVTKRPVTITTDSGSWVYDGTVHSLKQIYTDNLLPSHEIGTRNWTEITNVGQTSNLCGVSIVYYPNKSTIPIDITANYDITYVWGTLEITPRPLEVYTPDNTWIYDGQEHSCPDFYVNNILPNHYTVLKEFATITNAGTVENIVHLQILDKSTQADVTANYSFIGDYGTLEVLRRPITVDIQDVQKIYDGTTLFAGAAYVPVDSPFPLVEGHWMDTVIRGGRKDPGLSTSTFGYIEIHSRAGDVTANYDITLLEGTIRVWQARLLITSASDLKVYDGKPLTNPIYNVEVIDGSIPSNHRIQVRVTGSITNVGSEDNHFTFQITDNRGNDVSDWYDVATMEGILVVVEPKDSSSGDGTYGKVKADQNGLVYLRERSYGNHNGQVWSNPVSYSKSLPGNLSYNYLTSLALLQSGGYIHYLEFQNLMIPMLPYYMSLDNTYPHPTSDTATGFLPTNFSMSYYSIPLHSENFSVLPGNLGAYAPYEAEYRQFVYDWYLTVEKTTRDFLQQIIDREGFSLTDPNVISKVARYIQNAAVYSKEYDRQMDLEENVVIAFLDQYKIGKCTHYATAATLLYRTLGIPARYVEGFSVETVKDTFVDIGPEGHAWVEVYIDGAGWVMVEVTGADNGHSQNFINISPSYVYKNYDGKPLYPDGQVDANGLLSHLLQQGYTYEATVSGSQLRPGRSTSTIESFTLYDPSGADVTDQYQIQFEEGILEVFEAGQNIIRIYLHQLQKYYDGQSLTFTDEDFSILDLPSNLTLHVTLNISLTEPGSLSMTDIMGDLERYISYTVWDGKKNVTSQYKLILDTPDGRSKAYLPICVNPRPLEITSASQSKQEDGNRLSNDQVYISRGSLVDGHRLIALARGYVDGVGSAFNTLTAEDIKIVDRYGNDVTSFYDISIIQGLLSITPAPK